MTRLPPDFEGLLSAVLDGTADERVRERFLAELKADPTLLAAYAEQMEIHAALLTISTPQAADEPAPIRKRRFPHFRTLAAAAAAIAALTVWRVVTAPRELATTTAPSAALRAEQASRSYAAALSALPDAGQLAVQRSWNAQGLTCGVAPATVPGEREPNAPARPFLRLEGGVVSFTAGSGVNAMLCGAGEVCMTDDGLLLKSGYLVARVEGEISGFTVRTAQARIVDFGTAFAVDARSGDATEVTVTEGQVHVACFNDPSQETLLNIGQAARVEESRLFAEEKRYFDVYPVKRHLRETLYRRLTVNTKETLMNMMPKGVTVGVMAAVLAALPIEMQTLADTPVLATTVAEEADAPGTSYTLQTDVATTLAGLTVAGTLIKTGGASLTLHNSAFPEGGLDVRAGSAVLTATPVTSATNELPVYLRDGLSLWFDANRNVLVSPSDGTVDEWRDVRDDPTADATNCVYTRAVRYGADPAPAPTSAVNGLQALDFDAYGSGKWLNWVNPDGSVNRLSGIRTVFLVLAPPSGGMGFVLADWDQSGQGGGYKDFHKGSPASSAGGAIISASEVPPAPGWAARRSGTRVNATTTSYTSGYQLLEVVSTNALHLSNFCNDRNWRNGVSGYTGISRQGGAIIAEALIFTRELSESDRRAVAAYLNAKWFAKNAAGLVTAAAGTTVSAEVAASDEPLTLTGLAGAGTFEKTGTGSVALDCAAGLFPGSTLLRQGTLDADGLVCRAIPLDLAGGGIAAECVGNTVTVTDQADASAIIKTGEGLLCAASVTDAVARVAVSAGTLRLQPHLLVSASADEIGAAIPNPSFETNTLTDSWSYYATAPGWKFTASGNNNSGLTKGAGSGSPWCSAVMADGIVGAIVQRKGVITGQVVCATAGIYRLSFWHAGRPNRTYNDPYIAVSVDGVMGGIVMSSRTDVFTQYTCTLPAMTAGTHTFVMQGLRDDQDRSTVVDNLTLNRLRAGTFAALPNEGFEFTTSVGALQGSYPESYYMYNATNTGWQFCMITNATGVQIGGSGITDDDGTWVRNVPEGTRAAFMQQIGTMSTQVVFPQAGRYRLTFLAAGRRNRVPLDFAVQLNGNEVGRFQPLSDTFNAFALMLPERTAGETNTLAFVGLNHNNDGGDRSTVFDQVVIERVGDTYDPANGFEDHGSGWSLANLSGRTGFVTVGATNDIAVVEGTNALLLQATSTASRNVSFDAAGVYQVSFAASGRQGVSKNVFNFAHDFRVLFRGVEIGRVTTDDDAFRRYTFRLPYYASAGMAAELRFEGLNTQGRADSFSLIDDVRFAPLTSAQPTTLLAKSTQVEVSQGATLDLDFGGMLKLDSVWLGGRSVSGHISATSQPAYVSGTGVLYVSPKGTCLLVK